jgi:hypothetical protein
MLTDLRKVRPDETLRSFTQRFIQVRNKIPKISAAAIVAAYTAGVTDVKMREKLAMNDEITSITNLMELADKCSKAEEGRLFAHNDPDLTPVPPPVKSKNKDSKRKEPAVLAAEPEQKHRRADDDANKGDCPFCVYHGSHTHNTADCHELKKLCEERGNQKKNGNDRGYGRGGGRGGDRFRGRNNNFQQNQHANAVQPHLAEANNILAEDDAVGYQEPRKLVGCILGGAQAPLFNRQFKGGDRAPLSSVSHCASREAESATSGTASLYFWGLSLS